MQRTFYDLTLGMVEGNKTLFSRLVFSDEATFHLCGTVNRHNVRIWVTHHPHETVEHQKDFPKVNVFCAVFQDKVYDSFFFEGNTVTGQSYLNILKIGYLLYCKIRMTLFFNKRRTTPLVSWGSSLSK